MIPEELQRHLEKMMLTMNRRSKPEFEGYSPEEMAAILHSVFHQKSPIQLKHLTDADCERIPIFNQVKYLAERIAEKGEIQLTKKGFLPVKVVADLYAQGFIKDDYIDSGLYKLYKETDSLAINLAHILLKISGLTKRPRGKLSLTKAGEKIITDNNKLLQLIFNKFTTKFNWAYFDGFGQNDVGQLGVGFTLILLSKYGSEKRPDHFYAEKYFRAFPALLTSTAPSIYDDLPTDFNSCYSVRTFSRFLNFFGLVDTEPDDKQGLLVRNYFVTKTSLFDKFIQIAPPNPNFSLNG
ncbi:MAG: hypothetical protein RBR47_10425 [Bacteroidales bacterium]|jgi:hypothetical protein|nr:hypothetical protein [Bacteroidales bacterium]NCU36784.1 hypothetical protein [Candidatus Falkowbacteria bacterium]MDD2631770.1 hypothetical protein [Bacteroidales bacterium]MDD3131520.1 hypothetical protein [Bacteroidales bacterium]MDD3527068.1 hypothetical protein [Bacteroidales bacterium]